MIEKDFSHKFISKIISELSLGRDLTPEYSEKAFTYMISGLASDIQTSAMLMGFCTKGESNSEILSAVKVLKSKALNIKSPLNTLDTCGTGGDNKSTFNISTAVAILTSACGVNVAKHGNKAVSSRSGSSDVLSELGLNINASLDKVEHSLEEIGICFLMAPLYHSAMKNVANVRKTLNIRTIFNILGPLINPANTKKQLIGVFNQKWLLPMAKCLQSQGTLKAWIVSGMDGMDEITTTTSTKVLELKDGNIQSFFIEPKKLGLTLSDEKDLQGGSVKENAQAIIDLFKGKKSPFRDIVILNCAAALIVAELCSTLEEGLVIARKNIDNGNALKKLDNLIAYSKK